MKYKHHPKQEYPEYDDLTGIGESPEEFRKRLHAYMRDQNDAYNAVLDEQEPQKQRAGFYYGSPWKEQLTERDEREGRIPRYAMTENGVVEIRPWEAEGDPNPDYRAPTLFERFNSLCTPAQYVQLRNEIMSVFNVWRYHDTDAFLRETDRPDWPKELDGFTEEIIESL